jgi:hypothetical protein
VKITVKNLLQHHLETAQIMIRSGIRIYWRQLGVVSLSLTGVLRRDIQQSGGKFRKLNLSTASQNLIGDLLPVQVNASPRGRGHNGRKPVTYWPTR